MTKYALQLCGVTQSADCDVFFRFMFFICIFCFPCQVAHTPAPTISILCCMLICVMFMFYAFILLWEYYMLLCLLLFIYYIIYFILVCFFFFEIWLEIMAVKTEQYSDILKCSCIVDEMDNKSIDTNLIKFINIFGGIRFVIYIVNLHCTLVSIWEIHKICCILYTGKLWN